MGDAAQRRNALHGGAHEHPPAADRDGFGEDQPDRLGAFVHHCLGPFARESDAPLAPLDQQFDAGQREEGRVRCRVTAALEDEVLPVRVDEAQPRAERVHAGGRARRKHLALGRQCVQHPDLGFRRQEALHAHLQKSPRSSRNSRARTIWCTSVAPSTSRAWRA